jgi:C4-dicarboxylate-specific signal transduction histidine kinase
MMAPRERAMLDAAIAAGLLFDAACLVRLDADGRVEALNQPACRLFGAGEAELLGQPWPAMQGLPTERRAARRRLEETAELPAGEVQRFELPLQRPGADPQLIRWDCIALRAAEGPVSGYLCHGADITEARRSDERMRRSSERLLDVARLAAMGEMASGVAHELSQPLAAVVNYARAGERFLSLAEPAIDDALDAMREIVHEALRAGEVIHRLRSIVRPEPGERLPTRVDEVFAELHALTQAEARAGFTRLSFELAEGLPPVLVDRVQITQALLNLVRNAIEALCAAPVSNRQVDVCARRSADGDVEIDVCDNGPGVDASILNRLFQPFLTTKPHGTGLGLAMCRTITHAHGGTLRHIAPPPGGACFRVTLPSAGGGGA